MRTDSTTARPESWVRIFEPRPLARMRLFCFPYAGGGASAFRGWASELPKDVEVCAIQLPGRESRLLEEPYRDIPAIVQALATAIVPFFDRPYAFFGHSMGSLVAFELARELRRQHRAGPMHLVVSGHRAPRFASRRRAIHALPQAELIDELRRLNGTPEEVLRDPELMSMLLPTLRADFSACEQYTYADEAPLTCPISAFGGLQDPRVAHDDLSAWREQTTDRFVLRMLPGDHFFLRAGTSKVLLQLAVARDVGVLQSSALAGARR